MAEAYIVDARRTAGGRRGGALRDWHPADLGAAILDELVTDCGIAATRLEAIGLGERFLSNDGDPRAPENRRVEFQAMS